MLGALLPYFLVGHLIGLFHRVSDLALVRDCVLDEFTSGRNIGQTAAAMKSQKASDAQARSAGGK